MGDANLGKFCQAALSLLQGLLCLQELPVTVLEVLLMCEKVLVNNRDVLRQTQSVGNRYYSRNGQIFCIKHPQKPTMPSAEYPFVALGLNVPRDDFTILERTSEL